MITIISEPTPDTLAIRMSGHVKKMDYDVIVPVLKNKIELHDQMNLYVEMDQVTKIDEDALWEDLKFDFKHANDFHKVAMVGDKPWLKWMSKFADPLLTSDVRYFEPAQEQDAKSWIITE
jgi:hypothetical protein